MPLEFRKQRDGSLRDVWFGAFEVNGKRSCVNLGVRIGGTPPPSLLLKDEGDAAFERSRATALAKLENIVEEARSQRSSERLVEKLYEIKTGEQIKSVKLAELPAEWAKIARKRTPDKRYAKQCQSRLRQFADFVRRQNTKVEEIAHVTRTAAQAFLNEEEERGVTAKTWNDSLVLLRATFQHLLPAGSINPFSGVPTRETETVFRKPFTPEELKVILDAAQGDEFIRPVLVTGVCTAMRRGDCCLLKWSDVDLEKRFITVKTAKTGQTVSIPIFPLLFDELCACSRLSSSKTDRNEGYVFPEQATMYLENPDGITWRVRKMFAAAGFKDETSVAEAGENAKGTELVLGNGAGSGNGTVTYRGEIHAERKKGEGVRRASVRDFHSFRVTWVTLALTAGVPLELVQKVTGHKTTDIVLKHYFQPGREDFRRTLQSAMPKLLTNGQKSPKDEMREIVEKMTARTWKKDKARLLGSLAKV
jgi:integrase